MLSFGKYAMPAKLRFTKSYLSYLVDLTICNLRRSPAPAYCIKSGFKLNLPESDRSIPSTIVALFYLFSSLTLGDRRFDLQ